MMAFYGTPKATPDDDGRLEHKKQLILATAAGRTYSPVTLPKIAALDGLIKAGKVLDARLAARRDYLRK